MNRFYFYLYIVIPHLELVWVNLISCNCSSIWINKRYCDSFILGISHRLHSPSPQIQLIIVDSYQIIRVIHHVAVPLNIVLPAVLFSYHYTVGTHPQEEVHPALAPLIPFSIVKLKGQQHHKYYIYISRLINQPQKQLNSQQKHTQGGIRVIKNLFNT